MSPLIVPKPPPSGGITPLRTVSKVQKHPPTGRILPLTHHITSQSFQSLEESSREQSSRRSNSSTRWKNPPANSPRNNASGVFLPPTGGITPQTARAPSQPPTQMMPRSASGPCQSGYSPSRADAINCSGSCFAGSVFGLNGNFSARIFSYVTISSSYCNVRSISS